MKTFIIPQDSWDYDNIVFDFDAITDELFSLDVEIDEYPTELGESIAVYAVSKPRQTTLQGVISAWSLDGLNATKLEDAIYELFDFAKKANKVTVICDFDAIDCFITKVNVKKAEECIVEIGLVEATNIETKTVETPKELLAEPVKVSGQAEAKTNNVATSEATPLEKSYAAKLYDFIT